MSPIHVNSFVTAVINNQHHLGRVTAITKKENHKGEVCLIYYVLWKTLFHCSMPYNRSELIQLRDPRNFDPKQVYI
jgi:hypothetical protein